MSLSVQISASLLSHTMNDVVLLKRHVGRERADLYYTLSFSSVHKHKVLLIYAVGYRRLEKERSANNQVVETEIPKRERKDETQRKRRRARKYVLNNCLSEERPILNSVNGISLSMCVRTLKINRIEKEDLYQKHIFYCS